MELSYDNSGIKMIVQTSEPELIDYEKEDTEDKNNNT